MLVSFVAVLLIALTMTKKERKRIEADSGEVENLNNQLQNKEVVQSKHYLIVGFLVCIGPFLSVITPLIHDTEGTLKLVSYILLDFGHPVASMLTVPIINLMCNSKLRHFFYDSLCSRIPKINQVDVIADLEQ